MLRTTVSRVKNVCSGALVPRILRGDHCCGPVSYAVVRKAFESTKSTDDGKQGTLASEDNVEKKSDDAANPEDKTTTQNKPTATSGIPLTHRERCQRIIDKAFGPCEHTEVNTDLSEQYFSHTVNLEDTRREILESEKAKLKLQEKIHINPLLPESRTPYSIFINRELIEEDHDESALKDSVLKVHPAAEGSRPLVADKEDPVKPLNVPKATAEEPDLTKNLENIGTTDEIAPIIEPYYTKEEVEKFSNAETIENKTFREDDAETIEMVKDERKTNLYQKLEPIEQIHTLIPYTRTQIGVYTLYREDENQDEIVVMDSSMKTLSDVEGPQFADRKDFLANSKEVMKAVNDLETVESKALRDDDYVSNEIGRDEQKHMFIHATTAKEDAEQLTQKLETIEETPLVEAQVPKAEGFNVTPRVLGEQSILNSKTIDRNLDYFPRVDMPRNLDDVAKRCLNSPLGKIDEMLLNEIEQRPSTCKTETKYPSKSLAGDALVQMDEMKEQTSMAEEQEIHYDISKFQETEKVDCEESYASGLICPIPHITLECRLPDLNEQAEENELIKSKEESQLAGETAQANEQEIDTTHLKSTKVKDAVVTEIHILGIDKLQDSERTKSIGTTKPPLSEEFKRYYSSNDVQRNPETKDTYTKMTSYSSPNDALNNFLKNDRLLKSDYISNFKGVRKPTYYGTVNASKYAMNTQSKDDKTLSSRSLSAAYMWGHKQQDASASKIGSLQQEETDKVEKYGSVPQGESTKEQWAENEQTAMKVEFERVPYNMMRIPTQTWNNKVELSPKIENLTPLCSHNKTTEQSELKPEQEYVKVSITDELFKEHALDPYYVLACNETCPIAPVSTVSTLNNSDFVDTTDTIYMKKNICESKRPKPPAKDLMACEKMPPETQALHELDVKLEPEIIPEIGYTAMPETKSADTMDVSPPKRNELSLSELLKKVRRRNRLECMSDLKTLGVSVDPTVGKCNRKAPRCPPTAPRSPPANPVPPPSFGLPMLKRRPPVCKAPKKKPGCKCTTCDIDMTCGVQIGKISPDMTYELNEADICVLKSKADLTEEVNDRLNNLGKIMSGILRKVRSSTETLFARDYDPWTPIPSWPPMPRKKAEKKQWAPGKELTPKGTLIPYRCFYKTEWMKPKFTNKPYTTSREGNTVSEKNEYEETLVKPCIDTTEENVSEKATVKFSKASYPSLTVPNYCQYKNRIPANYFHLNLERLLYPHNASPAYVLVRYFATDIERRDVFWRPKARIPDENEMIRRLRDPDVSVRKEAEKEAKYLFLNYGNIQYIKKKNEDSSQAQGASHSQQSAMLDH
ncbi:hypothetical protein PYW08_012702 [Mythimna loreyi]|uniref:Uncharacterized protein n=1 Tax=Mythimna loreyi TaxID=667449 RepID=A0ACC2Q254_9NEOP|nr:hypothetical protein PYW08_012702 [Mythimna loreyi]